MLEFARPYTPDLVGWLRDFGQGAANYDANGHYARIQPIFNAFQFTDNPAGGVLTPIPPAQRFDALQTGALKRCPGAASQPPADGSAPYTDGGGRRLRPGQCRPGHEARRRHRRSSLAVAVASCSSSRRAAATATPTRCARSSTTPASSIPGEDVKVAGVKVGKIDSLDVTHDFKAAVVLRHRRPRLPGLPQRRELHRSGRSR